MSIFNNNEHHSKTIDSYFHSVWYDHDIIMGPYCFELCIVWCCEHIPTIYMLFHTYIFELCIQNENLYQSRAFSCNSLIVRHWGQNIIRSRIQHSDNIILSCTTKHVILKGKIVYHFNLLQKCWLGIRIQVKPASLWWQCPWRFWSIINQDPSVSKSNRLHVAMLWFFSLLIHGIFHRFLWNDW